MRTFDKRFPAKALGDTVERLRTAQSVRVRDTLFTADGRSWRNDFRTGMTAVDVASVIDSAKPTDVEWLS